MQFFYTMEREIENKVACMFESMRACGFSLTEFFYILENVCRVWLVSKGGGGGGG